MMNNAGGASNIQKRRVAAARANSEMYESRRDSIYRAAGEVFRRKGFHGATLQEIGREAGIDRASIYYYADSKEDLFQKIVLEAVVSNVTSAEEIAASAASNAEKLRRIIVTMMWYFENHYPYFYVFVQEDFRQIEGDVGRRDEQWVRNVREMNERYFQAIRRVIEDGVESGEFETEVSPGVTANCIIGMVSGSHRWFRPRSDGQPAEEIGEGMASLVLDGLQSH